MSIVVAILALSFLIVVHEFGHYLVARWCGMDVEVFSVGFGPGLLKWKSKKTGTVFQIAPIPFGGYAQIKGMNVIEDVDPDDKRAYPNRPTWQRMAAIFAGPGANYLAAAVLALGLYAFHGMKSAERWYGVAAVKEGYDAAGKLAPGDRILAIDGQPVWLNSPQGTLVSLTETVTAKGGAPVKVTVQRAGKTFDVDITPKLGTDDKGAPVRNPAGKQLYILGIQPSEEHELRDVGLGAALTAAARFPIDQTRMMLGGLWSIVTGKEKAEFGGPVRITEEFKKSIDAGWVQFVGLLMMLNVWLGLFNLLPIPALDGGRLVFLGYELVTRRRANARIEATIHMGGVLVLIVLMVLVTVGDVGRFF
ncbi:MAG: site-2 protease family protein [Kofleriaceae bacterium]|jgi:regulator of sigma E protease|nr:site-2 protease family protein [Kofleriaceae bacterium]MBP6836012.1 site-2 protease family protein [Kofleriaceae bacterium]MBP9203941.1 site-2 protease family protein [Kofleriaceae bacterium]